MNSTSKDNNYTSKFLDGFTKVILTVMFIILIFIFISARYMYDHNMEASGTDDKVNTMATNISKTKSHPFIELPGDAEIGAFSVTSFCSGLIVGHHWEKLFSKSNSKRTLKDE
jgi:cobalt/nickel transport protein